jgi:hypothetical protein
MLVFPQLASGSASMYPVLRKNVTRTVVNVLSDGSAVVFADPDATSREWELRPAGLTLEEATAIETLFDAASGGLATFTFLDPAGNLLRRSEEFGAAEWDNGPLISLTTGVADPLGTVRATRAVNTGSAAGAVAQTLGIPGSFKYVLSVWAKTTGGSSTSLFATTAGGSTTKSFALSSQWKRISLRIELGQNTESVTFGAELDPGASVDLFGMQLEAAPGVSDYKKTGAGAGVYAKARFAGDELSVTARGTDIFDMVVRITAN